MSPPAVLAIETSQRNGAVALRLPSGAAAVEPLRAARRHDDDLMPAIDRLFTRAGLRPRDLGTVGVSIGPGGFTGLRIAVSTAKMLAEALGADIVAVPTALVVAESLSEQERGDACSMGAIGYRPSAPGSSRQPFPPSVERGGQGVDETCSFSPRDPAPGACAPGGGPLPAREAEHSRKPSILIALASKGQTFWATWVERDEATLGALGSSRHPTADSRKPSAPSSLGPFAACLADAASVDLSGLALILGDEHLPLILRRRAAEAGVPVQAPVFDAAACLRLAERWLSEGRRTDPLALTPLYPRPPEAVTLWQRQRAR